jgi:hypothetical protein
MFLPGFSAAGSSLTSSSRSGDIGAQSFGGFGGVTFGDQGIDPRWLIGGALIAALLVALMLTKRGR